MARSAREVSALNLKFLDRNQELLEQSRASLASSKLQVDELSETIRRTRHLLVESRQWIEELSVDDQ